MFNINDIILLAPIAKVNVTGNNWIQHGDLLSLKVSCHGSKNIEYCVEYRRGAYNVTGNETCDHFTPLDSCDFFVNRYLSEPIYTIIFIIRNEVNKVVTPVTVTVYEGWYLETFLYIIFILLISYGVMYGKSVLNVSQDVSCQKLDNLFERVFRYSRFKDNILCFCHSC